MKEKGIFNIDEKIYKLKSELYNLEKKCIEIKDEILCLEEERMYISAGKNVEPGINKCRGACRGKENPM